MFHSILLVEDNPMDMELARRAFQRHQATHMLLEAYDGAEALALVEQWVQSDSLPQLVLLDLRMPEVSGFDVLARFKSDPVTREVPVVVLTGSADRGDIQRAYALGANSYMIKPANGQQYAEMVAEIDQYWTEVNVQSE
jgi:CheY-like chemotaxis protein